jgi:hypothetical protein
VKKTRNVLQVVVEDFAIRAGFQKKSGAWYRRQTDTIAVVELQKSQYGAQYFINVALWLLHIADAKYPKEQSCHLRTRLTRLIPDEEERLKAFLDLDDPSMSEGERRAGLLELLQTRLLPLLEACSTLRGIRSLEEKDLLKAFLVTGSAQRALAKPTF